jgi:hypothetical protein
MNVKVLVLASVWFAWCALPIHASDHYAFRVAEGLQSIAGMPQESSMVKALSGKPLMMLIAIGGTPGRWMLNGCLDITPCEFRRAEESGQRVLPGNVDVFKYDVGLTRIDATRFRLRCLRESCIVRHGPVEGRPMRTTKLRRGKSIELPVGTVIDLQLSDAAKR